MNNKNKEHEKINHHRNRSHPFWMHSGTNRKTGCVQYKLPHR